jgi:hypothetical protein
VHHPKAKSGPQHVADNTNWKAQQDKERRERAISETTGICVLSTIGAAVPVRLMKRDLLFVAERLGAPLDENRLAIVARQHGIKAAKDNDAITKLFVAFLRRGEESLLGRVMVELTIVLAASRNTSNEPILRGHFGKCYAWSSCKLGRSSQSNDAYSPPIRCIGLATGHGCSPGDGVHASQCGDECSGARLLPHDEKSVRADGDASVA